MKISLIISTYNFPNALRVSLESVLRQTEEPYEVIVADDGSSEETAQLIEEFRARAPFAIHHVWQPNEGFRAGTIRNKAIVRASGDYIVQIDGDIYLHPKFIADHASVARHGLFVCGSRVIVKREHTEEIFKGADPAITPFTHGISNRKNALRSPLLSLPFRHVDGAKMNYRGCNMAFWRQDLLAVNGYDEAYEGWGCEDHDLVQRLINHRILPLQLRHFAICYHLWHPSNKKDDSFERNNKLLEETRRARRVRARDGLSKYLEKPYDADYDRKASNI